MAPTRIAGTVDLTQLMESLADTRPVFHSEADFQFAFAQHLEQTAHDMHCRLEVAQRRQGRREYIDLVAHGPDITTAIEFKYFTRTWTGTAGPRHEPYELRSHAASDLVRLYYVTDIQRLETFTSHDENARLRTDGNVDGIAILLTNESGLWTQPDTNQRPANYDQFRIHHCHELSGNLHWANGYTKNTRTLRGRYPLEWHDYSNLDHSRDPRPGTRLRWLAVHVPLPNHPHTPQ